jgi:hypothetical protein
MGPFETTGGGRRMTEVPEADISEEQCDGLPGPAEPLPDHEPDEPTSDDYDEEVDGDG